MRFFPTTVFLAAIFVFAANPASAKLSDSDKCKKFIEKIEDGIDAFDSRKRKLHAIENKLIEARAAQDKGNFKRCIKNAKQGLKKMK